MFVSPREILNSFPASVGTSSLGDIAASCLRTAALHSDRQIDRWNFMKLFKEIKQWSAPPTHNKNIHTIKAEINK